MSFLTNRFGEWLTYIASISAIASIEYSNYSHSQNHSSSSSSSINDDNDTTETTSGIVIGQLLLLRLVPNILLTPFGGVLADDHDRRIVMIVLDLVGAVVALAFMLAVYLESIPLIYVATFVQECATGLYSPSRAAITPLLVSKDQDDDLKKATTMIGMSWSAMAAFGSAAGGILVSSWGSYTCFLIDSLTYVISAIFMMLIKGQFKVSKNKSKLQESTLAYGLRMMRDGVNYLQNSNTGALVFLKASAAMVFGAFDVLYVGFAEKGDVEGRAFRLGMITAASGVGSLLGPLLLGRFLDMSRPDQMQFRCIATFAVNAAGAFLISRFSNHIWTVCLMVACRAAASGALFVGSILLLQKLSEPTMLGRVVAIESILFLSAQALSSYIAGVILDVTTFSVEQISAMLGFLSATFLVLWMLYHFQGRGANHIQGTFKSSFPIARCLYLLLGVFLMCAVLYPLILSGSSRVTREYVQAAAQAADEGVPEIEVTSATSGYIMWSDNESWSHYCTRNILGNITWAKEIAPFVDKITAKDLVRDMGSSVKIIPTLAEFDNTSISNFSLEAMQQLPDPFIMKPTHVSGGAARVYNGTYECFKFCLKPARDISPRKLGPDSYEVAIQQLRHDLSKNYSSHKGEMQYSLIPHRVIVEKHLPSKHIDPVLWFVIDGHPLFAVMT